MNNKTPIFRSIFRTIFRTMTCSLTLSMVLALSGCGGGGGGQDTATVRTTPTPVPTPTPTEPEEVNTVDLEVDEDFSFRTDTDITLILTEAPQGSGVVNVYYDYEFHDTVNDIYYPDYLTRILSFYPQTTNSVEIQVSKNWQHLVIEYVPTDAIGVELYTKLDLTTDTTVSFQFGG